jgi:hypothetical protein
LLAVAIAAVPLLLSKSSSAVPIPAPSVVAAPGTGAASALPVVSVVQSQGKARLGGPARDPFTQQKVLGTTGTSGSKSTATRVTGATGSSGSTGSKQSKTSGGAATTTTPTTTTPTATTPTTTTPTVTPKPTPTGLTATQSYHVTFSITNSAGGLDVVDPLERLSVLPSKKQPLLVELGVLKGGRRVLFVVQPGTLVGGPGICTPGPVDCEILSLAQDQIETVSMQSATGVVGLADFAVTAIKADEHPSVAAANRARRMASATGRHLLDSSTLSALSLFQYQPSLGAVVDLRSLTVGGS